MITRFCLFPAYNNDIIILWFTQKHSIYAGYTMYIIKTCGI